MKNSRGSKKSTQKSKNTQNVDKIVAAKVNALTKGKVFRPTLILPVFSATVERYDATYAEITDRYFDTIEC
jgi:hypothetical protein